MQSRPRDRRGNRGHRTIRLTLSLDFKWPTEKKKEDLTQRARNGESCCCCCMGVHVLHQMVLYINSRSTPEWNTRAAEVSFFSFNFKGLVCDVFYLVHDDELGSLFFFLQRPLKSIWVSQPRRRKRRITNVMSAHPTNDWRFSM